MVFTDGAKRFADHGGAYWLLDEIAPTQPYDKRVAAEEFQVWTLKADLVRHSGTLTCEDGNGNKVFEVGGDLFGPLEWRIKGPRPHVTP